MAKAHELYEGANKRQFIVILVLIFSLVLSWIGFLAYEMQFDTVTETTQEVWQEADGDSVNVNRFVGGDDYGGETAHPNNGTDVQTEKGLEP